MKTITPPESSNGVAQPSLLKVIPPNGQLALAVTHQVLGDGVGLDINVVEIHSFDMSLSIVLSIVLRNSLALMQSKRPTSSDWTMTAALVKRSLTT